MTDYVDTRIGFVRDRSENEYIYAQAIIELERLERARKQRRERAMESFVDWFGTMFSMVARAVGYHLTMPRRKIIQLYKYLFDYETNRKSFRVHSVLYQCTAGYIVCVERRL